MAPQVFLRFHEGFTMVLQRVSTGFVMVNEICERICERFVRDSQKVHKGFTGGL